MTIATPARIIALVAAGLVLGGITFVAGMLIVGMGHGWDLPAAYGVLACLFYPLALVRWRAIDRAAPWRRDLAITLAVGLPICLALLVVDALPSPLRYQPEGWAVLAGGALAYVGVGWLAQRSRLSAAWGDAVLLVGGITLDVAAIRDHGVDMWAGNEGLLLLPWLLLWLGWQVILAASLVRRSRGR